MKRVHFLLSAAGGALFASVVQRIKLQILGLCTFVNFHQCLYFK